MKFFLDTANVEEIKRVNELGLVDGVTTNPTLISREGKPFEDVIKEITSIVNGPVSAEVVGIKAEEMIKEARAIAEWADNIVIKIPMTEEGLKAVKVLADEGIKTNVTLIFTVAQGLMATKAGASYISPFIGRLDDISSNGIQLVQDLRKLLDLYNYDTEIIAASIRNINHLEASAAVGAHIATIPGSLFPSLWSHPLTDKGIQAFLDDWKQYEQELKEK